MFKKVTLHKGDCLEVMDKLIAKEVRVDAVITSPPYNMNLRIRNGKYCSRQIVKELTTKYNSFSDNLPMEDYYDFNCKVIDKLMILSDLVFYNVQFLTGNKRALFKLIGTYNENIKEVIVWDKINAQPAIGEGILNSQFEVILVLAKSNAISRHFSNAQFSRGTLSNLWGIKRGVKVCKDHGATFPIELVAKIVDSFTAVGDVILDPFMGTGTTGEVCLNTGRRFIGIELDDAYYKFAKKRIKNVQKSR